MTTPTPSVPGAINVLPPLAGNEIVSIATGGPVSAQTTTQAIADLAALGSPNNVVTTISTVGAGVLSAAALVGKDINRTGIQTAAFTDTTATAAAILALLPASAAVGDSFKVTISNNQTGAAGYVETISGGTNVTVSGITTIPTGSVAEYLVTYSAATPAFTMVGRLVAQAGSGQLDLVGSTSGQTTLLPAAISATSVLTLPAVTGTVASTSGADLAIIDIYRTTGAITANASIVPTAITGLSGAVAVGTYEFEAALYCTVASGTAGIAINQILTTAVLGVCNFEAAAFLAAGIATQATATATSGTVLFTAADQPILILIKGSFTVTTAGTFGLQMCQNTSNASNTVVNIGSTMRLTRIA